MYLKFTSTFMEFIENIYLCQILLYPKTSISKVIEVYLPSNESTCNFLIHIMHCVHSMSIHPCLQYGILCLYAKPSTESTMYMKTEMGSVIKSAQIHKFLQWQSRYRHHLPLSK